MHKYIFVDTNLFEQFQPIENIDWLALAEGDGVTLVVPSVTLSELNRHKDGANRGRIKRRAASALSQLSKYARQEESSILRAGVDLAFRHQEPLIDFAAYRLSKDIADDRLLASAIEFACEGDFPDGSVMVATGDLGLELKTRAQRLISPLLLPSKLRLPDEADVDENKIRDLEGELRRLRNSAPQLLLSFRDQADRMDLKIEHPLELKQEVVQDQLAQLRCRYPLRDPVPADRLASLSAAWAGGSDAIVRYNTALALYYSRVEKHYSNMLGYMNRQRLKVELEFFLSNSGGAPADDIDIELHLPDGLIAIKPEDDEKEPEEPKPPRSPEQRLTEGLDFLPNVRVPGFDLTSIRPPVPPGNVRLKGIKKANSYLVSFSVKRLKHTMSQELPPILARFDSYEKVRSFGIEYRILAGNVPTPIVGDLHVVVSVL
jgi:hypothetical protein